MEVGIRCLGHPGCVSDVRHSVYTIWFYLLYHIDRESMFKVAAGLGGSMLLMSGILLIELLNIFKNKNNI